MRFQHILHALHFEPWLITETAHASLVALLESKLAGIETPKDGMNIFGDPLPKMTVADGIAEIPVYGTIGKGLGSLEKSCGATSVEDIQSNVSEAMHRPDVRCAILNINSPGGTVTGIPETADQIRALAAKKPVIAFTDGMMASAAYWLASSANQIVASKSSQVGSIGVYIPWADTSKRAEKMGVRVGLVTNTGATLKGMGHPGMPYTDEQLAHLQDRADEIAGMFKEAVTSGRKSVNADVWRGHTMLAASAKSAGLIDCVGDAMDAYRCAYRICSGSAPGMPSSARVQSAVETFADMTRAGKSREAAAFYAAHRDEILRAIGAV